MSSPGIAPIPKRSAATTSWCPRHAAFPAFSLATPTSWAPSWLCLCAWGAPPPAHTVLSTCWVGRTFQIVSHLKGNWSKEALWTPINRNGFFFLKRHSSLFVVLSVKDWRLKIEKMQLWLLSLYAQQCVACTRLVCVVKLPNMSWANIFLLFIGQLYTSLSLCFEELKFKTITSFV